MNFIFPPVTIVWVCNPLREGNFNLSSCSTGGPEFKQIIRNKPVAIPLKWNYSHLSETIMIKTEQQNLKPDLGPLFGPC